MADGLERMSVGGVELELLRRGAGRTLVRVKVKVSHYRERGRVWEPMPANRG